MTIHKPDPLGIQWDDPPPTRLKEGAADKNTQPEVQLDNLHTFTRREPDALVLVIRRMTCQVCHSISEAPENHLFLRTKGHFAATLQDTKLFDHLTRETKIIHLPTPRCVQCF